MKYKLKLQIQSANKKCKSKMHKQSVKRALVRAGVNCAKERLDQSFLFPGLEKGFTYDMDVITGEQPAIIWPRLKSAPCPPPRRKVLISALFT